MDDTDSRVNHILEFCKPYLIGREKIAEQLANFKEKSLNSIKSIARRRVISIGFLALVLPTAMIMVYKEDY